MSLMKKLSVLIFLMLLSSCQRQYTYTYLTQHPIVLKDEVEKCQKANPKPSENVIYCDMVMNAASTVMSIINEQQASPEAFGEKILSAELACSKIRESLEQAKKDLQNLTKQKADKEQIKTAEEKIAELKKQQQTQRNETKILLAVAGLNSPE